MQEKTILESFDVSLTVELLIRRSCSQKKLIMPCCNWDRPFKAMLAKAYMIQKVQGMIEQRYRTKIEEGALHEGTKNYEPSISE